MPKTTKAQIQDYENSFFSIVQQTNKNKHQAITTINKLMTDLYWFIGQTIVSLQTQGDREDNILEKLSHDLRVKYPADQINFSACNLGNMKKYYETYQQHPKLRALSQKLSWQHNLLILNEIKSIEEKEYYLNLCLKEKWSPKELASKIDSAVNISDFKLKEYDRAKERLFNVIDKIWEKNETLSEKTTRAKVTKAVKAVRNKK